MAANKSDLFDKEQVSEAEAREYAKEIGAVFKLTSKERFYSNDISYSFLSKKIDKINFDEVNDKKAKKYEKKTEKKEINY